MDSAPGLHETLHRRLVEVLALERGEPFTEDTAREAIVGFCETAVCCRWPRAGGKVRTFEAVFQAVYGKKLDGTVYKPKAARA